MENPERFVTPFDLNPEEKTADLTRKKQSKIDSNLDAYLTAKMLVSLYANSRGMKLLNLIADPAIQRYLQIDCNLKPIAGQVWSCQIERECWQDLLAWLIANYQAEVRDLDL